MNLFEPQADYAHHDTFLFALLGVASATEALEKLLFDNLSSAPEHLIVQSTEVDNAQQQIVMAILGLLSLSDLSQEILQAWRVDSQLLSDDSGTNTFGFDAIENLLR